MAAFDVENGSSTSPPAPAQDPLPSSHAPESSPSSSDSRESAETVPVVEKDVSFPEKVAVVEKDVASVEPSSISFKQESYFVAELKEIEKKALEEFKLKIEEAIKANDLIASEVPRAASEGETKIAEADDTGKERAAEVAAGVVEDTEDVVVSERAVAPEATEKAVIEVPSSESYVAKEDARVKENATPLEDVSLWGVPLLHTKGDERTDVILLKFLRARDFKVNEAFTMLRNTLGWRKRFGVDKLVDEDLGSGLEGVTFMHGYDKEGCPVCYNVYGVFQDKDLYQKTFGDEEKINSFLRWRILLLENAIKQLDFTPGGANSMVQITDLNNAPGHGRKEIRAASKLAVELLQDNYPEFVKKKVFINVPWYFSALYSMFMPFLTLRTKSKFVVARSGKVAEALFKLISPVHVPVQYGGLSRANDSDFKDAEAKCTELAVKPGELHTIEIPVAEVGSTVVWDLSVVGWNVSYGSEYVPNTEGAYTTIIAKRKKIASTEMPIRTSFDASEAGRVILTIDNTSSRKKKIAVYRYLLRRSSTAETTEF